METAFWTAFIALCFIAPFLWFLYRTYGIDPVHHMLGIAVIRDQDDVAIRRAVAEACKGLDTHKLSIEEAEHLVEETARHAVAQQLANANPGRRYEVTRDWPKAKAVICGNIATIRVSLGHDYMGDHDGIRAVNVEILREGNVLNLRPWAPKQPEPAPIGRPEKPQDRPRQVANLNAAKSPAQDRVEPKSSIKPAPKRAPTRRT